jgi:signal transduction protein with GAF and PtsI domain
MDERRQSKLLRRDPDLARLVQALTAAGSASEADDVLIWASSRDAERRSLANEALERYTELNLLYDLAEQCSSLDPVTVALVATTQLGRALKRGTSVVLVVDDDRRSLLPVDSHGATPALAERDFRVGDGIVGAIAADADGEVINDPATDTRATAAEAALGALMAAPLRTAVHRFGVLVVIGGRGIEFTAGEFRLLSAVAALTAPVLEAALGHQRTLAAARAREAELERQLDALRNEVEASRREQRVTEITSTDYFRSLREQADEMRRALTSGTGGGQK